MQLPTIPKIGRLSKHKITAAGATAATAVVLAVTGLQATGGSSAAAASAPTSAPTGYAVTSDQVKTLDAKTGMASPPATAQQAAAQKQTAADTPAAQKKAAVAAAVQRTQQQTANRSTQRAALNAVPAKPAPAKAAPAPAPAPAPKVVVAAPVAVTYTNNLDGWIKQSLDIMHTNHIPGSYNGIYRNIMRESSGNPQAINLWDSNAAKGIPSKGLLQVIDPTFQSYHVNGTSWNIYDPVANITAACNYAFHVYGSMDNVNSAY